MQTLDDIELQHLQRKDLLTNRSKFFNKLKAKFKFIANKHETLNQQILNLKYESSVYKQLWEEKQHVSSSSDANRASSLNESSNYSCSSSSNSCECRETISSRSSSTSSLADDSDQANESSSSDASSSSSSISSNQDMSEFVTCSDHLEEDYIEDLDELLDFDAAKPDLSASDYSRKLNLIKKLINLHKAKLSSKEQWSAYSPSPVSLRQSLDEDFSSFYVNNSSNGSMMNGLRHVKSSSLDLSECSMEGDRVVVENFNLRADLDLSDWCLTRQIESMEESRYKMPKGSVVKSGKVLRVEEPFESSQVEFLVAIKEKRERNGCGARGVRITTRLLAPDGCVKAVHTQHVPPFYDEVFKYANLIRFL